MSKRRSLGSLFDRADDLLSKHEGKAPYSELKQAYDAHEENKKNVELLWRLARACHVMGSRLADKDPKRKEIFEEGQKYGTTAEQLDPQHFNALKYAAVLTGDLAEHLPTRERIKAGYTIKGYLDKALKVQPKDEMLRHMRGRFCYAVASLTWMERTMAATFFATPPTATYDEAIADFLEVEKTKPAQWVFNLLYLGKSYLAKGDKENAIKFLKQAEALNPANDAEREAIEEVKALVRKHTK